MHRRRQAKQTGPSSADRLGASACLLDWFAECRCSLPSIRGPVKHSARHWPNIAQAHPTRDVYLGLLNSTTTGGAVVGLVNSGTRVCRLDAPRGEFCRRRFVFFLFIGTLRLHTRTEIDEELPIVQPAPIRPNPGLQLWFSQVIARLKTTKGENEKHHQHQHPRPPGPRVRRLSS